MIITIGGVAAQLGVATSTIRYYESQGLIPPAARRQGRRVYLQEDVEIIRLVRAGRRLGMGIAELKSLRPVFSSPRDRRRHMPQLISDMLVRTDKQIEVLSAQRDLLSKAAFCRCSDHAQCELVS